MSRTWQNITHHWTSNILPSQPIPEFLVHVARNVRERRLAAGLSQKALAEAAGVSLRMIGAIENGASSASTSTLDRIGLALDAGLADLVSPPSQHRAMLLHKPGWKSRRGGQGTLLTRVPAQREVETWEWQLMPGDRYQAGADPKGWHVQLIVVEGCLTLELEGEIIRLDPGIYVFDSAQKHAFANRGRIRLRFFRVTIC